MDPYQEHLAHTLVCFECWHDWHAPIKSALCPKCGSQKLDFVGVIIKALFGQMLKAQSTFMPVIEEIEHLQARVGAVELSTQAIGGRDIGGLRG